MIIQTWMSVLQQSFYSLFYGALSFVPNLVLAIIIFVIGWFVGVWVGWAIAQAIRAIKVDQALRAAGVEGVVKQAGYRLDSGAFLGAIVKWFIIAVFLVASLQVIGLTDVNVFLQTVVLSYLPHVIIAVLIILLAAVVAEAVQKVVTGSARAAGVSSAGVAGAIARWSIWIFAILAALDQLGVTPFIQTIFTGLVVALSLAFGLAFGLGGQDAAGRVVDRVSREMHHGKE